MKHNNCCCKESCKDKCICGNLFVSGSEFIQNSLNVNGPTELKDVRSRNNFVSGDMNIGGNTILHDVNILGRTISIGKSILPEILNEEIITRRIFNENRLFNHGRGFFYNNLFVGGNTTTGGRIFTSGNLLTGDSQFTRLNSFRGNLIDFGITPEDILNFLNDINPPLDSSTSSLSKSKLTHNGENHEELIDKSILRLIPDFAKEHPQFEKIKPIFNIKENSSNLQTNKLSAPIDSFGILDLGINFGQLTFDINNSLYIGIGPSIQILPLITLFPSYFLTDINVNRDANIDGSVNVSGDCNMNADNHVSGDIYLGGEIIYTNEENITLSDKLNSINNKLNYLANKLGLSPDELNEFMNL